jgi:hypothetical protein
MPHYHPPPNSGLSPLPLARRLAQTVRRRRVSEALSWLTWLLVVAMFAVWTHFHYQAPTGPDWIGMTIRTGVFAIWTQVVREWLMLYIQRRRDRYTKPHTTHRWERDD